VNDLGTSLAAAREIRGLSLVDAERLTNIRIRHLAALERGDYDALPGRTYARAFLRTYATALGLDANKLVAGFEEQVPDEEAELAAALPQRRALPVGKLALAAVVVGAFAVIAWVGTSSHANRTPPPANAAPVVSQPVTTTTTATTTVATPPPSSALVVSATRGPCWLMVRAGGAANGRVLFEGTLAQGETKRFAEPKLWIRFGAPDAVDVSRGGSAVAGLVGLRPIDLIA
jgi:cytoskeletal protein RodZ